MNVKRYVHDMRTDTMYKFGDGDYVKFGDYEKLYNALYRIYIYPEDEPLWDDDRDDAAWEIVGIAGRALNLIH